MTGSAPYEYQYHVTRAGGSAVDSLATVDVIVLESGDAEYNGDVKADFGDGNIVDVVKGDIIRFLNPSGFDGTSVGVSDYTERVVVAVDQVRHEVTLDLAILNNEVDGRPAALGVGADVGFRRNAQFRVMFKGFDTTTESHCNFKSFIPNIIGFPEHKRCLVQVQSFSVSAMNTFSETSFEDSNVNLTVPDIQELPVVVGIEIGGVGVQKRSVPLRDFVKQVVIPPEQ